MSRRPTQTTEGTSPPTCLLCGVQMLDGGDRWWCRGKAAGSPHGLEIIWPEDAPKTKETT